MNAISLIVATVLTSLGALFALDCIGWAPTLWIGAAVVSPFFIMTEVCQDLNERRPPGAWPWSGTWHAGDLIASLQRVLARH
ncbi:hypothetical protein G8A07_14795 [Roseateles sp. DAIF2]|uniref:hypothetical protein n=1 Tax=Roseateles sp. DAIF2 TaxID=2714952 RepID=UPI0018A2B84A|nr:hypothetical protein [Roseateles sp. DAIF2]QPF74058.1 hypothetical protein G8A07_14795 [Roseateles sp. DAIF2]